MAIPAIIVTLIAVLYLLDYALPQWRPKWMRPFVVEHHVSQVPELPPDEKRRSLRWVVILLALAALGCAAEVSLLLSAPISLRAVIQPFSWVSVPWPKISNDTANHSHSSSWRRLSSLLSNVQGPALFCCFCISRQLLSLSFYSSRSPTAPPNMYSKWGLIMLP